jgi:hypothetical protein
MRAVYRLIGLVRQYGPDAVEAACSKALDVDVIAVGKIASMLAKATENTAPVLPVPAPAGAARFARDPSEYATTAGTTMAAAGTAVPASEGTAVARRGTAAAKSGTGPVSGRAVQLVLIAGGAGTFGEED